MVNDYQEQVRYDDGMDEDQPLEDDPVLALADANDGAGEADAPYSE